tara:strand:- start:384 stop:563 length:180 start_codon:yes stop_codon:yes gene_type:complete
MKKKDNAKVKSDKQVDIFKKIWTGMKPFKRKGILKGQMSYIMEQLKRPVPDYKDKEKIL